MTIVKLKPEDIKLLEHVVGIVKGNARVYEWRIGFDSDGVKFKINNMAWSEGIGEVEK